MVFSLRYSQRADSDIDHAIDYYEEKHSGLGKKFFYSLQRKTGLIQKQPEIFPIYGKIYRKAILVDFPYNIFFSIESGCIVIDAIIHQLRGVEYIKNRLQ